MNQDRKSTIRAINASRNRHHHRAPRLSAARQTRAAHNAMATTAMTQRDSRKIGPQPPAPHFRRPSRPGSRAEDEKPQSPTPSGSAPIDHRRGGDARASPHQPMPQRALNRATAPTIMPNKRLTLRKTGSHLQKAIAVIQPPSSSQAGLDPPKAPENPAKN